MANDIAISVKNLTKTYRIFGHPGDRIKQALTFGQKQFHKEFTALKDVSFEIKKGETVGIIGRNGSGKSTLLQLICGILKPTSGSVEVNGRISALLELGAGFNPEFTGRENVYFQGAVMGIPREEMARRFDEIAAFADIGEFIDQPVRIYSSGMFVRLAFAVASSLDAEIIVIDEAMAVGDIAFQARCVNRIGQLKEQGITFLLVSHSMAQILTNSDCAILLDAGKLLSFGRDVASIVADHEAVMRNLVPQPAVITTLCTDGKCFSRVKSLAQLNQNVHETTRLDIDEKRFGSFEAIISQIVISQDGAARGVCLAGIETTLRFTIDASRAFDEVALGVSLRQPGAVDLWGDNNLLAGRSLALKAGENLIEYTFVFPFSSGEYFLHCGLATLGQGERIELDQRWPAEKVTAASTRSQVGIVHAPIRVQVGT